MQGSRTTTSDVEKPSGAEISSYTNTKEENVYGKLLPMHLLWS